MNWYAGLPAITDDGQPRGRPRIGIAALEALPPGHQAFQALSALIDAAQTEEMQELELGIKNGGGHWSFEITFFAPFARVELNLVTGRWPIKVEYVDEVPPEDEAIQGDWARRRVERFSAGLLRQSRWFHHAVIYDVGDLLADRPVYASRRRLYLDRSSKPSGSES